MKSFGFESARCKRFGEALQRLGANRFCAVESNFPGAQIELCALFFGHLPHAKVICEVWTTARRGAEVRDCLEPANRALQESRWRHENATRSDVERLQNVPDQSHVVIKRQPADDDR